MAICVAGRSETSAPSTIRNWADAVGRGDHRVALQQGGALLRRDALRAALDLDGAGGELHGARALGEGGGRQERRQRGGGDDESSNGLHGRPPAHWNSRRSMMPPSSLSNSYSAMLELLRM